MSPEDASARQRILETTMNLLLKGLPEEITTRQIADLAGVNVAAIHYYFQTKEHLIDEAVLAASTTGFAYISDIREKTELTPAERLKEILRIYAVALVDFPGISKTAYQTFLFRQHPNEKYLEYFRKLFEAVKENLKEVSGEHDEKVIAQKALIALSAIICPFLLEGALGGSDGVDYADRADREKYIELVLKILASKKEE
jgi:AcrR family transcriptional regulator